jgi:hypothetical protein
MFAIEHAIGAPDYLQYGWVFGWRFCAVPRRWSLRLNEGELLYRFRWDRRNFRGIFKPW